MMSRGPRWFGASDRRRAPQRSSRIANFTARIVRDFVLDDCPEHRQFEIHAKLPGQEKIVIVSASAFQRMNWVLDHLGPQAIVYPGQQQHARAAIQALSGIIPPRCAFSHLGWQKINDEWLYLDASGGVSAQGRRSDLEVRLPGPLSRYQVLVPDSQDRINAVRASLQLLSLGGRPNHASTDRWGLSRGTRIHGLQFVLNRSEWDF